MSQGMWVASSNWKSQGEELSPTASRKDPSPVNTIILALENHVDFLLKDM